MLPLLPTTRHGSRSAMTCRYRCGNACDHPMPNTSDAPAFADEVTRAGRRSVLKAGGVGASALVLNGLLSARATAATATTAPLNPRATRDLGLVAFEPVPPNVRDMVTVPDGFRHDVVIRWGDPVLRDAPAFDVHAQTPESAARQFGYNCDYIGVLPLDRDRALLVVNHEYTDEQLMFPAGEYDADTVRRIAMASHGLSVVEIRRGRNKNRGQWVVADHRSASHNRRITASTPFTLTGPVAGHDRVRTSADPAGSTVLGTLNNCAGGTTPWGTVLSGEENFNQYFGSSGELPAQYAESYARYGITGVSDRGWHETDPRFDLTEEPHEPFRFGWIVEVDPYDPGSTPVKHTMLGRFKHEGANVHVADSGQAVAYMGDDERGEYLYKFVSRDRVDPSGTQAAKRHNMTLLTRGTLYVARLVGDGTGDGEYDGTGQWIPLTSDTTSYVDGMSVADVLIDARLAADKVQPTRMDRPEDVQPNPVNGRIYAALTNNSQRGSRFPVDEANPLASSHTRPELGAPLQRSSGNRNGYVLEVSEAGGDHAGTDFTWTLLLVCGDPEAPETYFAGYPKEKVSPISCPDNVAFDGVGNLWVSTDGASLGSNDGLFRVPVAGTERGHVQQFLTVPVGAETCGPLITEDQLSVFVAVQHPGETDGSTFEDPSSTWPHSDDFPRPSVVVAYKR
jgi:hypothetical protein